MLSPAQLQALRDEVDLDPAGKGYAKYLPSASGVVVDLLNAPTERFAQERWVNGLTILSECGDLGPSIIRKLKAASLQDAVVEVAWHRLLGPTGLNVNDPETVKSIGDMVTMGAMSNDEAAQLLAMAIQPGSRVQILGLPRVLIYDLIEAGITQ
jgi:hypothetical protein